TVPSAPASASGVYSVSVNNGTGSGCTQTYTTSATVNASPNISSFSASAANACIGGGSLVTVNSSSLSSVTYTITYNLTVAHTATDNNASITIAGTSGPFTTSTLGALGATTLAITSIQSSNGCALSLATSSTFTVNPLPQAITGTNVVCAGLTTPLT